MDILDLAACVRYEMTLKQIALSEQMIHEGCPV